MDIIIVGCGKVGRLLADQLNEADNNVTVIDINPQRAKEVGERYDVAYVAGNGTTHAALSLAGTKDADLLIAVTGADELNLLCCLMAKREGVKQTIARVRSPQYNGELEYLRKELELAMIINPEYAAAKEIARVLRFPSALKIDTFARGKIELLKFKLPEDSPLCGMAVKEMSAKLHCDILVCTVERGEDAFIANGDFVFAPRDIISIIADEKVAYTFFRKINFKAKQVHDVLIAGGGNTTHYLCEDLAESGIKVKIIEKDPERTDQLSALLPNASVNHADPISREVLLSEGIKNAEAFVALTSIDEENILLSLFAKSVSEGKVITKINRIDFDQVVEKLELDTIIYPKNITSDIILRFVRASRKAAGTNLETLYQVIKGKVEAVQFNVEQKCAITDIPLRQMQLKDGVLVAAIIREKTAKIPRGQDMIHVGDSVVIVTTQLGLHDMNDILR